MSKKTSGAVVHRRVAVIACDSSGTLKETLHCLEGVSLEAYQLSERHLVVPAEQVHLVLERLKEHGQFPRRIDKRIVEENVETPEEAS